MDTCRTLEDNRKDMGIFMNVRRVIWIILDSVGIGALPDAERFGDSGTNTFVHVARRNGGLQLPNLIKLGLGNIEGMMECEKSKAPMGAYGRMKEVSNGKDTTIGHWEMIGIYSPVKFPTYPHGFPKSVLDSFVEKTGVPGVLGNVTASGTEIIKELGEEHMKTKKPIVYTSADSVFQIACHESIYSPEELYQMCEIARGILVGKDEVARVIARPFEGEYPFSRTANRRDFSKKPDEKNLLSYMKKAGLDVIGVGKIEDIFAGVGITEAIHTKDNEDGMIQTLRYMEEENHGLIFTNLVEFDSKWGHRNDPEGYGKGLEAFDVQLGTLLTKLRDDDLLIINADHGCDPTMPGTDHTREYVPLLVYNKKMGGAVDLGTRETFADVGQTIGEIFGMKQLEIGTSFLKKLKL